MIAECADADGLSRVFGTLLEKASHAGSTLDAAKGLKVLLGSGWLLTYANADQATRTPRTFKLATPSKDSAYDSPSSPAEVSLKLRWENYLTKHPPTSPLWDTTTYAVASVLRSFADPDGTHIYPTLAQVARVAVCSADTVSNRRKRLVDLGMIEVVSAPRNGRATVYALCEPERWRPGVEAKPKRPKPVPNPEPEPAAPVGEPVPDMALKVDIGALSSAVDVAAFWSAHREVWDTNPELLAALKARSAELAA